MLAANDAAPYPIPGGLSPHRSLFFFLIVAYLGIFIAPASVPPLVDNGALIGNWQCLPGFWGAVSPGCPPPRLALGGGITAFHPMRVGNVNKPVSHLVNEPSWGGGDPGRDAAPSWSCDGKKKSFELLVEGIDVTVSPGLPKGARVGFSQAGSRFLEAGTWGLRVLVPGADCDTGTACPGASGRL